MDNQTPEKPKLRGLYRNVNISVKVLDLVILACVAVIVLAVFFGQGSGYTVTFDSRGGSGRKSEGRSRVFPLQGGPHRRGKGQGVLF